MDNIVMKICKILIIICIICIFIISPLLDAYAVNDEDIVCSFVSYMNSNRFYSEYITIYEGIHIIDNTNMYVFTDIYSNNNIWDNYITYAVYIDGCNIIYDEIDNIYNYDYLMGLSSTEMTIPYTTIIVRYDTNTMYYKGDIYEN